MNSNSPWIWSVWNIFNASKTLAASKKATLSSLPSGKRPSSENRSAFDFVLDTATLGKIRSLFALDKEETFSITASDEEVRVKGKTYNYQANQGYNGKAANATLYKKYLNLLDREEYNVYVSSNKVVMKSNDTNTLLTIATCQSAE